MKKTMWSAIAIMALTLAACGSGGSDENPGPGGNDIVDNGGNTEYDQGQDADNNGGTDANTTSDQGNGGLAVTGEPCGDNTECESQFCLTTDVLTSLLSSEEDLEVPDGYCTKMMCASNADCGTVGKCLDLQPFDLSAYVCFAPCDPNKADACRTGYTCLDDPRIKDAEGNTGFSVCIPTALVNKLPPLNGE